MAERVTCRIGLDHEALAQELAAQYLPEECRAISETVTRSICIARYRELRPCWLKPIGAERLACVRGVLGLRSLAEEREGCDAVTTGEDHDLCLTNLRIRAYPYITFRFYDLEERAEGLRTLGAPMDLVAPFVISAEQAKQDFNRARSTDARIAIIRRVQSAWREFVRALPAQVRDRAQTEGIKSEYE